MMWKLAKLFKKEQTQKDELGNPQYSPEKVAELPARFTPYILKEQTLEGREISVRTQNILLRCTLSAVPYFDFLEFEGKQYYTSDIRALGRFTLLVLEGSK